MSALRAIVVVAAFTAAGCAPKYYAPNAHNVPLLREQGEGTVALSAGDWRWDAQGSYAPRPDMAVMLSATSYHPEDDEQGDGGRGHIVEIGVGGFRSLARRGILETYGVLALGSLENHFPSSLEKQPQTTGVIESRLLRWGTQSALGFRTRFVDGALSLRLTQVRYFDVSGNLVFDGTDQVQYLRDAGGQLLAEPAVTLRAGLPNWRLHLQLGRSYNLTDSTFPADDGHLSIGVGYHRRAL